MSSFLPSQVAPDICHNHLIGTSAEVPVIVYQACLPLIQEGQLSVSGERMRTILVNRLED